MSDAVAVTNVTQNRSQTEQLVKEYKAADLPQITQRYIIANRERFVTFPRTAEEHYDYVRAIYGINIPTQACFEDTISPFEFYHSLVAATHPDLVVVAPRGGSKTFYTALASVTRASTCPGTVIKHTAADESQRRAMSDYIEMLAANELIAQSLTRAPQISKNRWRNKSSWGVQLGTAKGISGSRPHLLTLDEVEFMKTATLEQSLGNPIPYVKHGIELLPVWAAFSTRQSVSGAMYWLVTETIKRGFTFMYWTVFETMQPCKTCQAIDEAPYGSDKTRSAICNLWEDCLGVAARKSNGWVPREMVMAQKRKQTAEGWRTQFMCKEPGGGGRVLDNFVVADESEGGNLTKRRYDYDQPEKNRRIYLLIDPAEGQTAVAYFAQIQQIGDEENLVVFDMVIVENCSTTSSLKNALWNRIVEMAYPIEHIRCIIDPHRTDAIKEFRAGSELLPGVEHSFKVLHVSMRAKDGGQNINTTMNFLKTLICTATGRRTLKLNSTFCRGAILPIQNYAYKTDITGRRISVNPEKLLSDYIDPLRYGSMYFFQKEMLTFKAGR
ncbi:hypothetical protein [Microcystis phage Mvi-JY20]|uniref:Terminase n=1 Tax=Microcystis phage Mvi-JY20 TaxID=3128146 RepID=A0AAX4QGL6_9CAUD